MRGLMGLLWVVLLLSTAVDGGNGAADAARPVLVADIAVPTASATPAPTVSPTPTVSVSPTVSVAAPSTPTPAPRAPLTVTVRAEDTGLPLPGACVYARPAPVFVPAVNGASAPPPTVTVCTDERGVAVLSIAASYAYLVSAVSLPSDSGYLASSEATSSAPGALEIRLRRGVVVRGTLRRADGSPVTDGMLVDLDPVAGEGVQATAVFDNLGHWATTVVPGRYTISYLVPLGGYAYGQSSREAADVVDARTGPVTVDDTLAPRTTITGHVRVSGTGAPVERAVVRLTVGTRQVATVTAADGSWTATVPVGAGTVRVVDPQLGRYAPADGPSFQVAQGGSLTGVDVDVSPGAEVAGVAVDPASGEPLPGLCPSVYSRPVGGWVLMDDQKTVCSGGDGHWSAAGLPPGRASVLLAGNWMHPDIWVGGAMTRSEATVLRLRAGRTSEVGSVEMPRGGTVTGRVTDRSGAPVAGATVAGGRFENAARGITAQTAVTDANGLYHLVYLPRSAYVVVAPPAPYAWQWSGAASRPDRAQDVPVPSAGEATHDVVLGPGGTLAVTVRPAAGQRYYLQAATPLGDPVGPEVSVTPDQPVALNGLGAGRYVLRLFSDGKVIWFGGAGPRDATRFTVREGAATAVTVDLAGS